jgi:hypothetical protein
MGGKPGDSDGNLQQGILGGLVAALGMPMQGTYPLRDVFVGALIWLIVGIALIGLAGQITRLVYGKG